jgi:light-independent protochlorophyllide reductase subunit B
MFREDFEFGEVSSHLGKAPARRADDSAVAEPMLVAAGAATASDSMDGSSAPTPMAAAGVPTWTPDGEKELKKIPFFVRKKARLNTERFAAEKGIANISVETLYEAKAHYGK